MTNSIFGTAPNQAPLNSHLGPLAYVSDLNATVVTVLLTTTQSWTPPYACVADIYVTGGGGTAALRSTATEGSTPGGTAGTAIKFGQALSPGVVYTAVVGAAGAIPTSGSNGNAGSPSSFSGAGIATLTGNGGPAGWRIADGTVITGFTHKVDGGEATGGDINLKGGAGHIDVQSTTCVIGSPAAGNTMVRCQPSGDSFWGPGADMNSAAFHYGTGSPGTSGSSVYPAKQGVIMIRYQGAPA